MPRGRILELKNNYGIIDTDAYKVEHEWIPFRIEKSMLEEKEGKQYIKYTDEVVLHSAPSRIASRHSIAAFALKSAS